MNAFSSITVADLSGFLSGLSKEEPRIADFLSEQPKFHLACELAHVRITDTVPQAIDRLDYCIDRETKKQARGHYTFDGNRFIAFKQLRAALSEFARTGRKAVVA